MNKYAKMTTEDFDTILVAVIKDDIAANGVESLLRVPGVYEVLAEEFNNAVLDRWTDDREDEELRAEQESNYVRGLGV